MGEHLRSDSAGCSAPAEYLWEVTARGRRYVCRLPGIWGACPSGSQAEAFERRAERVGTLTGEWPTSQGLAS